MIEPDRPIDLDVESQAVVLGDADRLRQVVDNLLDNARVHTPAGSPVHVNVGREGEGVVLSVTDEGPGLLAGDRRAGFRAFLPRRSGAFQDDRRRRTRAWIVRAIVEAHGGEVRVVSRRGAGATLEIRLPVAP